MTFNSGEARGSASRDTSQRALKSNLKGRQDAVLRYLGQGLVVKDACTRVGTTEQTFYNWCKRYPEFKRAAWIARGMEPPEARTRLDVPDFPRFCEEYLGFRLFAHQLQWFDLLEGRPPRDLHPAMRYEPADPDLLVINTPPAHGKALALDTALPTPTGWTTMGEVQPGDWLLGARGRPVLVEAVSPVFEGHDCYEVEFASGQKIIADAGHLWKVNARSHRRSGVLDTETMYADHLEGAERRPVYSVDLADPIDLPDADLPIPPYTLGAWLGDGTSSCSSITVHTDDEQILDEIRADGWSVHRTGTRYQATISGLRPRLREAGVLNNKHVPDAYLRGSLQQRLSLLQGLMDTDGTISKAGQAFFTNTNRRLIDAVSELVHSLGMKARTYARKAVLNGKYMGVYWEVSFYPADLPVFRLVRKLERQNETAWKGSTHDMVVAIRPAPSVPVKCVVVADDGHLFLAGRNMIPTHNSSTITIAYCTWRIVRDPTVRIVIVSKAQRLAMQFLLTIKTYLTHPTYERMQTDLGPPGGFATDAAHWKADMIYVGDAVRDTQEKDPTVQAIGIGGQLYGARCDLVVLDDTVDNLNAGEFEKQSHWVQTEVVSRIPDGGKVLLVGTRMAAQDIYSEIRRPERYGGDSDASPWTYFAQPAVLAHADRPEDWETLWPRSDRPAQRGQRPDADGLYVRWDGPSLARRRRRMSPAAWERVYQQAQVGADAVFDMEMLLAAQPGYSAGLLQDTSLTMDGRGTAGRRGGMAGLRIIAGLDPAAAGHTAAVVVGLDPATGIQWVLDCHNEQAMLPHAIKDLMKSWVSKYGIAEWVVEKNGFQGFLSQDVELRTWIAAHGGVLREHWTGAGNKMDPEMGVAGMAALFDNGLVKLPRTDQKAAARALVDQLSVWAPGMGRHVKTDLVMALWFASRRCTELTRLVTRQEMFDTGSDWFRTRWDLAGRHITESLEDEMRNMPQPSIWAGAA